MICNRKSSQKFCTYHEQALETVKQKYEDWKQALDIEWTDYLESLHANPLTGTWVKEVVDRILKEEA